MTRYTAGRILKWTSGITYVMLFFLLLPPMAVAEEPDYVTLKARLIQEGFDGDWIRKLYGQSGVTFETRGLSLFFAHREAALDYSQFLSFRSMNRAREYMDSHQEHLTAVEKTYGVQKEIIVAVMLVETRLGRYTGNSSVINTLSTMSALNDNRIRDLMWKKVPGLRKGNREKYIKWAKRKSTWAYGELTAFLTYARENGIDPLTIKGSYAGAMGIPQFMPSNIAKFAQDGDRNGRIDLFAHPDAMASIANYLKHYGWKPGLDRKEKYKVLLHYNYSKYYANTLIDIAEKLKG